MSDIKSKAQGLEANLSARDIKKFTKDTDNIYEALAIIAKRSKQLSVELKKELNSKLEEFAITSDSIEEIQENKEQIEISKFYERLPNPALIATNEFFNDELTWRNRFEDDEDEDEKKS